MTLLILLLPIIASLLCIILFKKSGFFSGIIGILLVFIVSYVVDGLQLNSALITDALLNTFILTLSALLVIFPGLLLNNILEVNGYNQRLQSYLKALPITDNHKVLILMFGLLPALESITGFGVSLILAVPVFASLLGASKASKVSMLSMNIMPWGTLGLATIVGAQIANVPIPALGLESAYFCLPILAVMAVIAVLSLSNSPLSKAKENGGNFLLKDIAFALLLSICLSVFLMVFNKLELTEIAGVLSGLLNFFLFYSLFLLKNNAHLLSEYKAIISRIFPYILVVLIIVAIRSVLYFYPQLIDLTSIHGVNLKFSLITSPFLAILCVCLLFMKKSFMKRSSKVVIPFDKTIKACSTLFVFILLSQLMNFSSAIDEIVTILSSQSNIVVHYMTAPFVGLLGGFITGSNLGGNALLMTMQSNLGLSYGDGLLFSAIQNVSSGYSVFSSLPIIVLILTLLKTEELKVEDNSKRQMEQAMLKFGLKCLIPIYLAIVGVVMVI